MSDEDSKQNKYDDEFDKSSFAQKEEEILDFWRDNNIFEKTLKKDAPEGEFVFYEGPPTANGRPGIHHMESRSFKDAIPRFRTMQGYHVRRKAGWDTHGLPVELEVEKNLGFETKHDIEEFGVANFNEACKENVWKYIDEWKAFTTRMGYWLDFDDAYVTYYPEYMETLWWIMSQIDERDLLYKDYKVLPWCPRCETALSSHELAQGYETVKDLSITAKFKLVTEDISIGEFDVADKDVSFLAWTTTPWTLPGNIALAVGEELEYAIVRGEDPAKSGDDTEGEATEQYYILAKALVDDVFGDTPHEVEAVVSGSELVGRSYEPLYPFVEDMIKADDNEELDASFRIYAADFVTTEDGTGIVHTAVMYGQDDFALGDRVGLPKIHLVKENGRFKDNLGMFSDRFVHDTELAVDVIKDLYHENLLFAKDKYEHEYPHCWRCDTKLVYYARESWYIRMSELRDELQENNENINWEPNHIKDGRFGEWLSGAKDWAISRERFWGTPLPVWESEDGDPSTSSGQGDMVVIGSLDELKEKTKSSNAYIVMRHGEAEHNVEGRADSGAHDTSALTKNGKEQSEAAAKQLKGKDIDFIYTSPFERASETADIIAREIGIESEKIIVDERIGEFDFGEFDDKPIDKYREFRDQTDGYYQTPVPGGESHQQVKERIGAFLYEIDAKHQDETILIVSHGVLLEVFPAILKMASGERNMELLEANIEEPGTFKEYEFSRLPHNEAFELDLHRPYIDDITWQEDGQTYTRVPEVMDVWFDSGAMPLAQDHYPFDFAQGKPFEGKELSYPADFISEAIDQTRGWFYTMHAIGTLLERDNAYKNVICLGHIMAADGSKMSKSKGNAVNPWEAMSEYGADVVRFWMYSINQPGESKSFDPQTVDEVNKKVFNLLQNIVRFYEMFAVTDTEVDPADSEHVLDRWILSRRHELVAECTEALENYDLLTPTRAIRDFIGEFSRWYIRRSRERFKSDNNRDRAYASATTRLVLETLAQLLAPFAPFTAEDVYRTIADTDQTESVHLNDWPEAGAVDDKLHTHMRKVRAVVSDALDVRSQEGIKVRQPLAQLQVKSDSLEGENELIELITQEVNVKEVEFGADIEGDVALDTKLTDDLKDEGVAREIIRQVQRLRKKAKLDPEDDIGLVVDTDEAGESLIGAFAGEIKDTAGVVEIEYAKADEVSVEEFDYSFGLAIKKV